MNDDMPWVDLTPEEIQELRTNKQHLTEYGKQKIRELMEKDNTIIAKVSDEDLEKVMDAAERQELINEAFEELNAIVLGGQNTREFYLSISHIRNVLERLK